MTFETDFDRPVDAQASDPISEVFRGRFRGARILVTGHTGFKGSWLCRWLVLCGAEVHGYALDPPPEAPLYRQLQLSEQLAGDHRGDVRDRRHLEDVVRQVEPRYAFHLAAQPLVRRSYRIPQETIATNVMGTANFLETLRMLHEPCAAVVVTTDKCYENREWLHGYRETDPLGGKDPYSASKAAAELITASYRDSFLSEGPVRVASARAGNVIGGGDWAADRLVPDCIRCLRAGQAIPVRNPFSTRPWQHVLEPLSGYLWLAARLIEAASTEQPADSPRDLLAAGRLDGAFNFGPPTESNRRVGELVEAIVRHYGSGNWRDESDPAAAHEASRLDLATAKALHLLDWRPVWDFDETVRQTIQWYRAEEQGGGRRSALRAASTTDEQIRRYVEDAARQSVAWAANSGTNRHDEAAAEALRYPISRPPAAA